MRFARVLLVFLAAAAMTTATAVQAQEYNRFGKGPTTIGLTPSGRGANSYSRGTVYYAPAPVVATVPVAAPAPVVATAPATDGRRTFSAEPSAPGALAPAAPVPAMRTGGAFRAHGYDRFGKGPTTSGLTPLGYGGGR
jgi:hypothetical protein